VGDFRVIACDGDLATVGLYGSSDLLEYVLFRVL